MKEVRPDTVMSDGPLPIVERGGESKLIYSMKADKQERRVLVLVSAKAHRRIKTIAADRRMKLQDLIAEVFDEWLVRHEKVRRATLPK